MGWTDFGMLRRYVRILDPIAAAQLAGRDDVTFDAPEIRPLDTSASVTRVDAFGDDASELWNRTWGASAAGGQRSAEFLNWRYVSHPRFAHRLFELRRDGTLEGLAVSRLEQVKDSPLRVARLLELVADERHAPALLTAAADDAAGAGAAMIDFFIATARLDAALRSSGFVDGDQPPASFIPVLYQPIDRSRTGILFMANLRNAPDAAAISEWYVTKSDGDQDRPS
jgi:hypothetical protein